MSASKILARKPFHQVGVMSKKIPLVAHHLKMLVGRLVSMLDEREGSVRQKPGLCLTKTLALRCTGRPLIQSRVFIDSCSGGGRP
jgi:hypothetical protein